MDEKLVSNSYKFNTARYRHYYRELYKYTTKPPVQISLALLLTVFTIVFFAVVAIRPTLTTITKLVNEIEDKKVVLEQLKKKSAALATAQLVYAQNSQAIAKLEHALPETNDPQQFLRYIEAVTAAGNIPLQSVSVTEYEVPPIENNEDVQLLPININIVAPYQDLVRAMGEIYNTPRFVAIDSMGISTENNSEMNDINNPQMVLRINLIAVNPKAI